MVPGGPAARQVGAARPIARSRKARLTLKRIDPWSVFVTSLVISLFLGVVIVVAAVVLQGALSTLGIVDSVNDLYAELTSDAGAEGGPAAAPLLTTGRIVGGAALLAAIDVVLLTVLATLGAFLYNLCASFTGGVEVTLGERD